MLDRQDDDQIKKMAEDEHHRILETSAEVHQHIRDTAKELGDVATVKYDKSAFTDALQLCKQASTILEQLSEKLRNDEDWRNLAYYIHLTGLCYEKDQNTSNSKALACFDSAIATIKRVAVFKFEHWHELTCYQANACRVSKDKNKKIDYLTNAIVSLQQIPDSQY